MSKIEMGKQYIYRNGEPARVLCVDAPGEWPVVAINGCGTVSTHLANGRYFESSNPSKFDLIPAVTKKTVWVNVYKDGCAYWYDSKEDALRMRSRVSCCLGTYHLTLDVEDGE